MPVTNLYLIRHLMLATLAVTLCVLAPQSSHASMDNPPYSVEVGSMTAPVIRGDRAEYLDVVVSLRISGEIERRSIYRLMPRLKDAILQYLFRTPLTRSGPNSAIDFGPAESGLLPVTEAVAGHRVVIGVELKPLAARATCGKPTAVRSWRKDCG